LSHGESSERLVLRDIHVDAGDWVIGAPGTEEMATADDVECWCLSRIEPRGTVHRVAEVGRPAVLARHTPGQHTDKKRR
jgi:hypothetical protein